MHFRDHAYSEYVLYVGIDRRVRNLSATNTLIYSLTHKHTQPYTLVQMCQWWFLNGGAGAWLILVVGMAI